MKRVQGKHIAGYVTVHVQGEDPELFFQTCANAYIPIWDVKKNSENHCEGKIYIHHVKKVKKMAETTTYHICFSNRKGSVHHLMQLWKQKEVVISILLCATILFLLAHIVWKVEITGVSVDLEKKIDEQLAAYGLYEGAWSYSMAPLDVIQQDILHAVPELLYIGIQKKGTTYYVDGVEKLIVKEEAPLPKRHLIAAKNGVIQKIFVREGISLVDVYDVVKKGDLLVSGIIRQKEEEETEEDEGKKEIKGKIVAADGEIYANTWYEVTVTSSLHTYHENLSGEKVSAYQLQIGSIRIPIWGFKKETFTETVTEVERKPLYFLKWQLPLQLIEQNIYNKETNVVTRTVEEAKKIAIQHVQEDLQLKLGNEARILKYNVLHETEENGKVKLNLYISVLENIATEKPIDSLKGVK